MDFNFLFFLEGIRQAVLHIPVTLSVAASVMGLGIVFGFAVALTRCYRVRYLAAFFRILVTVLRGIPIILILLTFQVIVAFTYDDTMARLGLPYSYRNLNKAFIAIAAMSLPATVSMSEVFRGSFAAVDRNQFDASTAIGHRGFQTLFRIVLPQMIPVSIPMTGNIIISTIKSTSLLMYLSVVDILNGAALAAAVNYRFLEAYLAAALVFWGICALLEWLFHILERKTKLRGAA
ncbi:MAG: ABC transporter permease subunit [Spirochaetaceae bacterium]|jgi:L-cystine transport system permease protein|nr:ABC transporter permease subunit [Spirochaetaceae bacterium]